MFGININGEFLDFPEDGKLTFELNLGSFDDQVIPGSIAFPANFPSTPKNNRIFSHVKEIAIVGKRRFYEGVFWAFGAPYDRCKLMRLESDKDVYRFSVILNGVSIDIKEKTLRQIDTSSVLKSFDKISELIAYMNLCNEEDSSEPVYFPRIRNDIAFQDIEENSFIGNYYDGVLNRYTSQTTLTPYAKVENHDDFFPRYFISPKVKEVALLKMLFAQYGYSVGGTFINDPEFSQLGIISDRIMRAEKSELIQVSDAEYSESLYNGWHIPRLGFDNPMDADHLELVEVGYNHVINSQFPSGILKIKLDTSKTYRVSFRANAFIDSYSIKLNYWFIQQDGINPTFGEVAYQVPVDIVIVPNFDMVIEDSRTIDFSSGFSGIDDEVWLIVALKSNFGADPSFSLENCVLQVIEIPDDELDAQIEDLDISGFVPDTKIEDWLTGLKTNFNLRFFFNPWTKEITINHKVDDLVRDVEVIDHRIGDQIPLKANEANLISLIGYDWERLDDEFIEGRILDISPDQVGTYELGGAINVGQYEVSPITGLTRYRYGGPLFGGYRNSGYYLQPLQLDDVGKDVLMFGRAPILTEIDATEGALQPVWSRKMRYSRYGIDNDNFTDCRFSFNRGQAPNASALKFHPTASILARSANNVALGTRELWFNAGRTGSIYSTLFKRWISFLRTTERLRDKIQVDRTFLERFFSKQMKLRNTVFLPDRLTFTITTSGIEEAEIEMYKNNFEYESS